MQMFIIHDDNDGNLIILGYCMLDHTDKSFDVVAAAPPVAKQKLLHWWSLRWNLLSLDTLALTQLCLLNVSNVHFMTSALSSWSLISDRKIIRDRICTNRWCAFRDDSEASVCMVTLRDAAHNLSRQRFPGFHKISSNVHRRSRPAYMSHRKENNHFSELYFIF